MRECLYRSSLCVCCCSLHAFFDISGFGISITPVSIESTSKHLSTRLLPTDTAASLLHIVPTQLHNKLIMILLPIDTSASECNFTIQNGLSLIKAVQLL